MTKPIIAAIAPKKVSLNQGEEYYFCTCGRSNNQPFCDGSHAGTDFKPKAFTAQESGDTYLCQCKHTANSPFCDGSHKQFDKEQVAKSLELYQVLKDLRRENGFLTEEFQKQLDAVTDYLKEYDKKNIERKRINRRNFHERRKEDPAYKIERNCRGRISKAINRGDKAAKTKELLGCSIEELKDHLEDLFVEGMTWQNYGLDWHIDQKLFSNGRILFLLEFDYR